MLILPLELLCLLSVCSIYRANTVDVKSQVVRIHNIFRSLVGRYNTEKFYVSNMKKVTWDASLAEQAAMWASNCQNIGRPWSNTLYDGLAKPLFGMNVAVAPRGTSLFRLIGTWFKEQANYSYEHNTCKAGTKCENYMMLASATTDTVGCALNLHCKNTQGKGWFQFFVCVYSPGLNTADHIYNIGKTCTECDTPASFCDNGLCVTCDKADTTECDCRKTCRRGDTVHGVLNPETCSCSCTYGAGPNCDRECKNPEQYLDYDICGDVTPDECEEPDIRALLAEFCPEQCVCRK